MEQTKSLWDSRRFAELITFSVTDAAQYCVDCGNDTEINGVSVYDIVGKVETQEKKVETQEEAIEDKFTEDEQKPVLTKEDLQELLKANNIEFKNTFGEKRLLELAIENGLLV